MSQAAPKAPPQGSPFWQFSLGFYRAPCVAGWRKTAVIPLREIRRALKSATGLIEPGAAELFRTKVKGLELEAERLQQEALFALSQSAALGREAASADAAARANIAAYERYSTRDFSRPAVDTILAAFGAKHG